MPATPSPSPSPEPAEPGEGVKLLERADLARRLDLVRLSRQIVFTNGCFDLLHVGHVRLLQQARRCGDLLVVGVNSDRSVRQLKGPARPVVRDAERAEILAALACVDYVVIFDEDTPVETLRVLRPHIHVKGGDYRPEDLPERATLAELGARLEIFPLVPGRSTTRLLENATQAGDEPSHESPSHEGPCERSGISTSRDPEDGGPGG